MSPAAFFMLFLMPISGKLVSKIQPKYMIAYGFAAAGFGMWLTSHITSQVDYETFALMRLGQV